MKQPRAILWIAVSSGAQAGEDKQSLPEQDYRLREIAERKGWQVVDQITVPGHSRVYYNYRDFAEAALDEGIPGPMRMFEHWQRRDFDVFACASGDRFGREQAIFAEVVGRTVDGGATVFTLRDGEINRSNKRMFVSMAGYQASVEIDELVRRHKSGMAKRARKGLPLTSAGHIYSHTTVGEGVDERTVVNEAARRLFMDIADLLISGVSWQKMPELLAERGHVKPSGRNYSAATIRNWMMHPTLYGNTAQHFQDVDNHSLARGFWVFDPAEPAPEYVTIHYGTHPPMYDEPLASRVKAEMRRRFGLNGKAHPQTRRRFSGFVVCDVCHHAASYKQDGAWLGVRCTSRNHPDLSVGERCENSRYVSEKKLIQFADAMLARLLEKNDWSVLLGQNEEAAAIQQQLAAVKAEKDAAIEDMDWMIEKQRTMPKLAAERYDIQIRALDEKANALDAEKLRLEAAVQDAAPTFIQLASLEDLRELTLEGLWRLPPVEINQYLSRILGKRRFAIFDGEVIGTTAQPRKYHYAKRR